MLLVIALYCWKKKRNGAEMTNWEYFTAMIMLALMLILGAVSLTIFLQSFSGAPFNMSSVTWKDGVF